MRIIRAIVNIIGFATMPVWMGFYIWGLFLLDIIDGAEDLDAVLKGDKWLLED